MAGPIYLTSYAEDGAGTGVAFVDPSYASDSNTATYAYALMSDDGYYDAWSALLVYGAASNASQNCVVYVIGSNNGDDDTSYFVSRFNISFNSGSSFPTSVYEWGNPPSASAGFIGPTYSWPYMRAAINTNAIQVQAYIAVGDTDSGGDKAEIQLNDVWVYYENRLAAPASPSCTAGVKKNTVSWSAVGSATKYYLFWGTSASLTESSSYIDVGNVTNYEHTGLTAGQPYYYKVAAFLNYGPGTQSSEVNGTPVGPTSSKGYITSF